MENNLQQNNIPGNVPPVEKPSVWVTNPNLKILLVALIFVFLACGIFLVVLMQVQSYYRNNVFEEALKNAPKHQNSQNDQSLKSYSDSTLGIQFSYPSNIAVNEFNGIISLSHSIPFENHGDCDMKGDENIYPNLNDFGVSVQIKAGTVAQVVKNLSPYMPEENFTADGLKINPGFIDEAQIGDFKGFSILEGAEGCGHIIYYFPVNGGRTLVITKANVQMLSNIIAPEVREAILKVPGVITPEQSNLIFNQIMDSLKVTFGTDSTGWKIYKNEEYGFEFKYPEKAKLYFLDIPFSVSVDGSQLDYHLTYPSNFFDVTVFSNDAEAEKSLASNKTGKTRTIDGKIFVQSLKGAELSCNGSYFYKDKNLIYDIAYGEDDCNGTAYEQILSTFKFTN